MSKKYNLGTVQQGISKTELWRGSFADSQQTITLNDSVKNYKFIYLYFITYNESNHNSITFLIDTDDINNADGVNAFVAALTATAQDYRYFGFNFLNGFDKLTTENVQNCTLKRIVGIN